LPDSKNKLVSVVIVSYNSADSITRTLDSIYNQTYPNIELVISDDASNDDTVAVAAEWIEKHKARFSDCILIANEKNQGVAENLNTGIRAATGAYIKDFGADDLLLPDYLQTHVAYLEESGEDCVFSNMYAYQIVNGEKRVQDYETPIGEKFYGVSAKDQYKILLRDNCLFSPTFLATRALYEKHGLYDTRFPLMEDYPYYLKIAKEGTHLNYLDVRLVEYCFAENSISNATSVRVLSPNFHKMMRSFFYKVRLKGLLKEKDFKYLLIGFWKIFFGDCVILFGNKSTNSIVRFCNNMRELKFLKSRKNKG